MPSETEIPTRILPLQSLIPGAKPSTAQWIEREIAINVTDGKIYVRVDEAPILVAERMPTPPSDTGTFVLKVVDGIYTWVEE
jgi:hypothetical protein